MTDNEVINELALFAGAGGGILGGHLLGWRTVCAVEWNAYAAGVLVARQNDGTLPPFPIWDDVQTFDGRPWRGRVDVVSGGFPCQDISAAGKGAGINGERSGMWAHMARIVCEVEPRYVFVENSPMLTSRGLGRVLGDLASLGYDARWGVLGACDAGAPHRRDRIWIVANAQGIGSKSGTLHDGNIISALPRKVSSNKPIATSSGSEDVAQPWDYRPSKRERWWQTEPDVGRVANGVAARVDRLAALGNGQVPAVARMAFEVMS